MLCCIGDLVEDVVVWLAAEPKRGTDTAAQIFRRRGGSAANVAVLAVQAGGRSRFVGQVGQDRLGTLLVGELEQAGVDVTVIHRGTTGSIVVLVGPDGERTMLPDRGAATQLAETPHGALDDVTWLHVPGYSLIVEPLGATTRALIAAARADETPMSIDASSTGAVEDFGIDAFKAQLAELEPDILFCNRDEAQMLEVGPNSRLEGVQLSIVKDGADPVVLVDQHGNSAEITVPPVAAVADTTGAGDAFAAGFLVATMEGANPAEAAQAANRLAATVLLRPGAGSNKTSRSS